MTLPEAQAIVTHYGPMAYLNNLQVRALAQAKAVVKTAAEQAMQTEMKGICIKCCGDGFHRVNDGLLSGPCELCEGRGTRQFPSNEEKSV